MLETSLSHLKYPAVMRATVTAMSKVGDKTWMYNIKLQRVPPFADELPEVPNIKSHVEVEAGVGGTVAVALLYGKTNQLIIVDEVIS